MKALVLQAAGPTPKLAFQEAPEPELGPRDVLLRVLACSLCHHDRLTMQRVLPRGVRQGVILGHEICGEVAACLVAQGQVWPVVHATLSACEGIVIASPDESSNRDVAIWGGVPLYPFPLEGGRDRACPEPKPLSGAKGESKGWGSSCRSSTHSRSP